MSDSRRVHRAIKAAVKQLFPTEPTGHMARHLETLAGIVLGRSCQLPKLAAKAPDATHPDSRSQRSSRWLQNDAITPDIDYLPSVQALLTNPAALRPLVFVMNATEVGRGCLALLVSVLYGRCALPVAWVVVQGCKGNFPTAMHRALLALVPAGTAAQFPGDGEFDGIELQQALTARGWEYVCRTAKSSQVYVAVNPQLKRASRPRLRWARPRARPRKNLPVGYEMGPS